MEEESNLPLFISIKPNSIRMSLHTQKFIKTNFHKLTSQEKTISEDSRGVWIYLWRIRVQAFLFSIFSISDQLWLL